MAAGTLQQYEKIARMLAMEVSQTDIAAACNLSSGRISQILGEDEFKNVYAQIVTNDVEKAQTLNEGWDALEEQAIGGLLQTLQFNKNPDLLLRVAAVANKAQRRGTNNRIPVDPASIGTKVVINLQQNFVNKLEQNVQAGIISSAPKQLEHKQLNMMAPGSVEKLLSPVSAPEEMLEGVSFDTIDAVSE